MKSRLLAIMISVLAVVLVSNCALAHDNTLTIAGSTTIRPVAEELARAFAQMNPGVRIMVQGGGSGQGIENVRLGVVDIGMSSRELTPEGKGYELKDWLLAGDGIAVVVNRDVSVDSLTIEQIGSVFSGEIVDWSDVGGSDAPIVVINREDGSCYSWGIGSCRSTWTWVCHLHIRDGQG